MKNDYDIFERFADGSTVWRSYVCGKYEAMRKVAELSEHSENQFYAINLKENKSLKFNLARSEAQRETKDSVRQIA